MESNFTNEPNDNNPGRGEAGGGKSRMQILVLLLIVAVFGYVYFFTGLIRPKVEPPKEQPQQGAQVKKPMPQRPAATAEEKEKAAKAPEAPAPKPAAVKPAAPPQAQTPAPKPEPAKVAKPVPAKPEPVKAAKPVAAKTEQPKPQAQAKAAAPVKPSSKVSAKKEEIPGKYTLFIGEYVVEKSMNDVKARMKKAGVTPVVKKGGKKNEPMNRLFLDEFSSHEQAKAELDKLQALTKDAFILNENGKYSVYAGSYFLEGVAAREQDRLYKNGVKLVMKKTTVPVALSRITAGSFPTKEAANLAAARLKKLGLKPAVVECGK